MSGGDGGHNGGFRVSIPVDLRKTIELIREITGKQHSDEDIFSMLKDCFNDPHETAQKLLYLDTFHDVKTKRDRRKENSLPTTQGQGKSSRGRYSSNYTSSDASGGRNAASRRDNGAKHITENFKSSFRAPRKARNNAMPHTIRVSDGPPSLSNGVTNHKRQDCPTDSVDKPVIAEEPLSKSTFGSGVIVVPEKYKDSSVSDPFVVPNHIQAIKKTSLDNHSRILKPVQKNMSSELHSSFNNQCCSLDVTSNHDSQSFQVVKTEAGTNTVKAKTQSLSELDGANLPHVTFPLHFELAKALQNGLKFGSFSSIFEVETICVDGGSEGDSLNIESSHVRDDDARTSSPGTEEILRDPYPSQSASTTMQNNDHDNSQSAPAIELVLQSDHSISPGEGSKEDEPKQAAALSSETHQLYTSQNVQSYGLSLMPPPSATSRHVQFETSETQIGSSGVSTSLNPTSADQSSVMESQQPIPLFRQPYPPNYFPYGPYLSPFYMPYIYQYLSPNGLPQQSYLPPGATAPGVKLSFSQFEPGTNTENPNPIGIPSAYGSSPVAFNLVPPAPSISSTRSEDLTTSQSKENIYSTRPQSESSPAWMQNFSNLQVNSLYNLPLQGQHVTFSQMQAGHGGFDGIYQPTQTMVAPSTANTAAETVGPPPVSYQQPQLAQYNWNTNY